MNYYNIAKVISCVLVIFVIMMPVARYRLTNIQCKNFVKRFFGILICVFEVGLIIYFFYNMETFPTTNISVILLNLLLGVGESILSVFIRNYKNREALHKLFCNLTFELNSILREMIQGIVSCGIEEIVWRGVVQEQLFTQQEFLAVVFTSFAFTASHVKRRMYFGDMLEIFILSCILGGIMIFTKNILYCFAFHWARNCIIDIIQYNINRKK